jgi:alkylhydroperoxidase family enzyme
VLGEDVWDAVRADWRTAPVSPQLRAALGFIEKQTLTPEELTRADAEAVYAAGVSRQALADAARVAALFNMIVRLADSFGWDVPEWEALKARAPRMLEGRYVLDDVRARAAVLRPA